MAIADIRAKMRQSQNSIGAWNIKRMPGGLIDTEFIVQSLLLRDPQTYDTEAPGIAAAISRLKARSHLSPAQAEALEVFYWVYVQTNS